MSFHPSSMAGSRAHYVRRMARRAVRCSGCGSRFRLDRMRFLAQRRGAWLYMARCTRCQSLAFIGVVVRDAQRELCDATAPERERFLRRPPVSVDDVLNMHRFLDDFGGDFSRLLGKEPAA